MVYNRGVENLVDELKEARTAVVKAVSKVPINKREVVFLGDWSLKDLIAHLTGWAKYQLEVIKDVQTDKTPKEPGNIDGFNKKSTEVRALLSWDKAYSEFLEVSQKLIGTYKGLKTDMWDTLLWDNKKTTLKKFINIEIRHYKKTHLPQILRLIKD